MGRTRTYEKKKKIKYLFIIKDIKKKYFVKLIEIYFFFYFYLFLFFILKRIKERKE